MNLEEYYNKELNKLDFYKLHKLLINNKYSYNYKDYYFLEKHYIYKYPELILDACKNKILNDNFFIYSYRYINEINTKYLKEIDYYITDTLWNRYLIKRLCFNNYNLDSLTYNNYPLYYDINNHNYLDVLNILKVIKNSNINRKIVIRMYRVNKYFIKLINDILPSTNISPVYNQDNYKNEFDVSYTIPEILELDNILDNYANSVKDKIIDGKLRSLSIFEKYVACYTIATRLMPYFIDEKNKKDYYVYRSVYEIIKPDSKDIVCTGYVNLLIELLNRVGIKDVIRWDVRIHDNFLNYDDHTRLLIYLNDSKYNINGIFMADPTLDRIRLNSYDNSYNHILLNLIDVLEEGFSIDQIHILDKKLLSKFRINNYSGKDKINFIVRNLCNDYNHNSINKALESIKKFCDISNVKNRENILIKRK